MPVSTGTRASDRSFFRNETRAFLALPEIREQLLRDEPFLHRPVLGGFSDESQRFRSSSRFWSQMHFSWSFMARAGIGKTRLLCGSRGGHLGKW